VENGHLPSQTEIERAASLLRSGKLVASDRNVYGLGANAFDAAAVARIFEARAGRIQPIIVHVSNMEMVREVAAEWLWRLSFWRKRSGGPSRWC